MNLLPSMQHTGTMEDMENDADSWYVAVLSQQDDKFHLCHLHSSFSWCKIKHFFKKMI